VRKTVALLLLVFALTSAGKALTAPAPVPGGSGGAAGSGYEVRDVRYALSPADPTRIAGVTFELRPAGARSARVRLSASGRWYACSASAGRATCAVPGGERLAAASVLEVAALS
jgi:hypothetical protein